MLDGVPDALSGGVAGNGASYGAGTANTPLRSAAGRPPLLDPSLSPTDLLIIDHYWLSTVRTILFRYLPSCSLNPSPFKRHACYECS